MSEESLTSQDKEELKRRLELLQKEYEKTALRLQRAERREAVRKHVQNTILKQNRLLLINTSAIFEQNSSSPEQISNQNLSSNTPKVHFHLPDSSPFSAMTCRRSPSRTHRLRSRRSRLRLQVRERESDTEESQEATREETEVRGKEEWRGIESEHRWTGEEKEKDMEGGRTEEERKPDEEKAETLKDGLNLTTLNLLSATECSSINQSTLTKLLEVKEPPADQSALTKLLEVKEPPADQSALTKLLEVKYPPAGQSALTKLLEVNDPPADQSALTNSLSASYRSNSSDHSNPFNETSSQFCSESIIDTEICPGSADFITSCTLIEGLPFPVEYYVRTTRRMASAHSSVDLNAVILSQLSNGRGRRRSGRGRDTPQPSSEKPPEKSRCKKRGRRGRRGRRRACESDSSGQSDALLQSPSALPQEESETVPSPEPSSDSSLHLSSKQSPDSQVYPIFRKMRGRAGVSRCQSPASVNDSSHLLPSLSYLTQALRAKDFRNLGSSLLMILDMQDFHLPDDEFGVLKLERLRSSSGNAESLTYNACFRKIGGANISEGGQAEHEKIVLDPLPHCAPLESSLPLTSTEGSWVESGNMDQSEHEVTQETEDLLQQDREDDKHTQEIQPSDPHTHSASMSLMLNLSMSLTSHTQTDHNPSLISLGMTPNILTPCPSSKFTPLSSDASKQSEVVVNNGIPENEHERTPSGGVSVNPKEQVQGRDVSEHSYCRCYTIDVCKIQTGTHEPMNEVLINSEGETRGCDVSNEMSVMLVNVSTHEQNTEIHKLTNEILIYSETESQPQIVSIVSQNGPPFSLNDFPFSENGPPLSLNDPPLSENGPPLSQNGPTFSQNDPPLSLNDPPPSENDPPLSQIVPPLSLNNPLLSQISPPLSQNGLPLFQISSPLSQNGLPLFQIGPPLSQNDPPSSQIGPTLSQNGPPLSQFGAPLSQICSPLSQNEPPLSQNNPPLSHSDLRLSQNDDPLSQNDHHPQNDPPLSQNNPFLALTDPPLSQTGDHPQNIPHLSKLCLLLSQKDPHLSQNNPLSLQNDPPLSQNDTVLSQNGHIQSNPLLPPNVQLPQNGRPNKSLLSPDPDDPDEVYPISKLDFGSQILSSKMLPCGDTDSGLTNDGAAALPGVSSNQGGDNKVTLFLNLNKTCQTHTGDSQHVEVLTCGSLQKTHTLKALDEGCVLDVCLVRWPTGDWCVCVAGEWSVCVWKQNAGVQQWSLLYTWTFTQSVISLQGIPDSSLLCVCLGTLEIIEARILYCPSTHTQFSDTELYKGALQAVLAVSDLRVTCCSASGPQQNIQVFTLTQDGRTAETVSLVSSSHTIQTLVVVEKERDALIGWTEHKSLLIWNMKSGQLLQTIRLVETVSTATCLRGYSYRGVLYVLLQRASACHEETASELFTLIATNPLTGKYFSLSSIRTLSASTERLIDGDVCESALVGVFQSGLAIWNLTGGVACMYANEPADTCRLARWAGPNTLLTGYLNGDVNIYQFIRKENRTKLMESEGQKHV